MSKKSFNIDNPALQFMTPTEEKKDTFLDEHNSSSETGVEFKELKRGRPIKAEEKKTKRLNLLMFPSVCEDINKIATMERKSINELINCILQEYIKDNQELVIKYNEVFSSK